MIKLLAPVVLVLLAVFTVAAFIMMISWVLDRISERRHAREIQRLEAEAEIERLRHATIFGTKERVHDTDRRR